MNQFIVQKLLEKVPIVIENKIELLVADNGLEALNIYSDTLSAEANSQGISKVKLILMDCEMPVLDGYEASKRIRELEYQIL